MTGDNIFPLLCGIAQPHQAQQVLARLEQPDFWTPRGMRTVPNTDPKYNPRDFYGLLGGSWPNLTLWYASVVAPYNADRALAALEKVAEPVLMADSSLNTTFTEFPEYFDGDTGINLGMRLSPWVAPTFIWAVMEGLLGLQWRDGKAQFQPRWPSGWEEISLQNVPSADGPLNVVLRKD
jgi:glycogen debranching enzyme